MTLDKQLFVESIKDVFNGLNTPLAEGNLFRYLFSIRKIFRERTIPRELAVRQMLMTCVDILSESHDLEAQFLKARGEGDRIMDALATELNVSVSHLYRIQKKSYTALADIVLEMNKRAVQDQQNVLQARLEVSNNEQLVGIEDSITHLMEQIQGVSGPWIVFIEGIGGIGKTSLAGVLCRRAIDQLIYDEVGWVSASQSLFTLGGGVDREAAAITAQSVVDDLTYQLIPELAYERLSHEERLERLHARLNETPHLIVVDNLETVEDVEMLLPTIQRLANPTKFVLTSRKHPVTNAAVHSFVVPILSERDSLALLSQEAIGSNLLKLDQQGQPLFRAIYETVGGNPLALRLVIGQARFYSVEDILTDLRAARNQPIEKLYNHIYRWAWEELTPIEREVFLSMLAVGRSGDSLSFIVDVNITESNAVRTALQKLATLNLIYVDRSDPHTYLYSIHSLTRTFLQNQVGGWW